ncbi:Actin cytoskeleton-regulatory complex protein [Actinidia chinensis var. chinensis]|uniref:Actin cytoskeleton-regulatory complex protein n=1 Tax=Actinidia chinensis var. chinensis TaxID=1590841 RepID=A0A2R6PUN4_ACTCC|nr:Actin cytoskeleton-regulatory complex protein [Actinidia chinensis var. chinensis]
MATTVARGSQTVNSMYIKPMLRKAYHKKGSCADVVSDAVKLNGEEVKNKNLAGDHRDGDWWVPDHRTGIYYPKGQEKVIENVPLGAGKDFRINWFSNNEDFI